MQKQRFLLVLAIAAVAALAGVWLAQIMNGPANPTLTTGTILSAPRPVPAFELVNTQNQTQTTTLFKNRWSVLFFGYTSCPDVCPTTLTQLAQINAALADVPQNKQPQFVFISIDPKRDTPTLLSGYLRYFDPRFIGLTGTQQQIDDLTRTLGVPVLYQPLDNSGDTDSYSIDHAATLFVVDPQMRLYAVFTPPFDTRALTADLRRIVTR